MAGDFWVDEVAGADSISVPTWYRLELGGLIIDEADRGLRGEGLGEIRANYLSATMLRKCRILIPALEDQFSRPWQCLYFLLLPQGQASFRPMRRL